MKQRKIIDDEGIVKGIVVLNDENKIEFHSMTEGMEVFLKETPLINYKEHPVGFFYTLGTISTIRTTVTKIEEV